MKVLKMAGMVVIVLIFFGCAQSQYVSDYALKDPAKAVSLPHPVEMEKSGIEAITQFTGLMAPELWPEVVACGGVWPALARVQNGELLQGFAYLSGITYWGDFLLRFIFMHPQKNLSQAKILYLNRDAGWLYQFDGKEINYDAKKFDSDAEYQAEMFSRYGWDLGQLDDFWIKYFSEKGLSPPDNLSGIYEIKVKSPKWKKFKTQIKKVMGHQYKMPDGEIRMGYLPLEEFRQSAVVNPGFQTKDRFVRNLRIPLILDPMGLAASAANAFIATATDGEINGHYARAKVLRRQMAPIFRYLCEAYKNLLRQRDERIRFLEQEVRFQKILAED